MRAILALALAVLASAMPAQLPVAPYGIAVQQGLPEIAPAPAFTLISQDGAQVSLADFRGKVVAVTFIYTLCGDTCPILTPMRFRFSLHPKPHGIQVCRSGNNGQKVLHSSVWILCPL